MAIMFRVTALNNVAHHSRLLLRIRSNGVLIPMVLVLVLSSLATTVLVVISSGLRMFQVVVLVATAAVLEIIVRAVSISGGRESE